VSIVEEGEKGSTPCRGKSTPRKKGEAGMPQKRKSAGRKGEQKRRKQRALQRERRSKKSRRGVHGRC